MIPIKSANDASHDTIEVKRKLRNDTLIAIDNLKELNNPLYLVICGIGESINNAIKLGKFRTEIHLIQYYPKYDSQKISALTYLLECIGYTVTNSLSEQYKDEKLFISWENVIKEN